MRALDLTGKGELVNLQMQSWRFIFFITLYNENIARHILNKFHDDGHAKFKRTYSRERKEIRCEGAMQ